MNELAVIETSAVTVIDPKTAIDNASKLATAVADVIEKQKLYTTIQGKKYVRVDAYIALGNIRGIYPREVRTTEHDDGTFESFVELVDQRDGRVIGGASAIVGSDEATWKSRPRFARRSMAITRATGKAFRIRDAWILALAGYETTPSEEMENVAKEKDTVTTHTAEIYQAREDQEKRLTEWMTKKDIPADKQKIVKARMMNRHSSELADIVASVMTNG
jgi:hypothetical protein